MASAYEVANPDQVREGVPSGKGEREYTSFLLWIKISMRNVELAFGRCPSGQDLISSQIVDIERIGKSFFV